MCGGLGAQWLIRVQGGVNQRTYLSEASLSNHGDQLEIVDAQGPLGNSTEQNVSKASTPGSRNVTSEIARAWGGGSQA